MDSGTDSDDKTETDEVNVRERNHFAISNALVSPFEMSLDFV